MLMAICQQQLVSAENAPKGSAYTCPGCSSPVILKRGERNIAHFAHQKNSDCQLFSEGETKEHLQGKQQLADWFRRSGYQVTLEAYLPALKQRPDILVQMANGQSLAIEFQCAPISHQRLQERTSGYQQHGYPVIWILGKTYWKNGPPNKRALKFLQYRQPWHYYLAFWLTGEQQLVLYQQLWQIDWLPMTFQIKKFNAETLSWSSVLKMKVQLVDRKISQSTRIQRQQSAFKRNIYWSQPTFVNLQVKYYTKHRNLQLMPSWLYDGQGQPPWNSQLITYWRLATLNDWLQQSQGQLTNTELMKILRNSTREWLLDFQPACLNRQHVQLIIQHLWRCLLLDCQQHGYLIRTGHFWHIKWGADWPSI